VVTWTKGQPERNGGVGWRRLGQTVGTERGTAAMGVDEALERTKARPGCDRDRRCHGCQGT